MLISAAPYADIIFGSIFTETEIDQKHDNLRTEKPGYGAPSGPIYNIRGKNKRQRPDDAHPF